MNGVLGVFLIIAVAAAAGFTMWAQSASARDFWRRRRGQ